MADFDPTPPPLDLPAVPAVLSPSIPLNPPMVGSINPFQHVDGNNRDIILEAIRTWVRVSLLPWTTSWQEQLTEWEGDVATQLDAWMVLADDYITAHAISGLSFRSTVTDIAPEGTTNVVLANVDETLRPVVVGDLVLDNSTDSNYGIVTVVIDDTHATVLYVGSLRGLPGFSWRLTPTPIAPEGTTNVVLSADNIRPFSLGDLVLDTAGDGNFGIVTTLIDATHVTVTYAGSLIGPQGIQGIQGEPGTNGTNGTNGHDGLMTSVVAGTGIAVDSTDPANPIVSLAGAGVLNYDAYSNLNDGNTEPDGSIGSVKTATNIINSLWLLNSGTWHCVYLLFDSNDPAEWADTIAALAVYTNLSFNGAHASDPVNSANLSWSASLGKFVQDTGQNRVGITTGGNTDVAPTYGANGVINIEGTHQLELRFVAPDFDTDNTDCYTLHLWGIMNTNGVISFTPVPPSGYPDTDASHYMEFGGTVQYNAGVVTHDADFYNAFDVAHWDLVTDTTGSPTFVDIKLRIMHVAKTDGQAFGNGFPMIGYSESVYFTNPSGDTGSMVMFKRTGTHYYFGTEDAIDWQIVFGAGPDDFFGNLTITAGV
jgi:hypothetical protein